MAAQKSQKEDEQPKPAVAAAEAGSASAPAPEAAPGRRAFREGIVVEATNPKTAAFFLAFIPQFLDPAAAHPALQFMALGLISVTLNTLADVVVVVAAAATRANLARRSRLFPTLRRGSGLFMMGLGASLLLARRPGTG